MKDSYCEDLTKVGLAIKVNTLLGDINYGNYFNKMGSFCRVTVMFQISKHTSMFQLGTQYQTSFWSTLWNYVKIKPTFISGITAYGSRKISIIIVGSINSVSNKQWLQVNHQLDQEMLSLRNFGIIMHSNTWHCSYFTWSISIIVLVKYNTLS